MGSRRRILGARNISEPPFRESSYKQTPPPPPPPSEEQTTAKRNRVRVSHRNALRVFAVRHVYTH